MSPFHARTASLNRMQMWFNWDLHIVPDVYTDFHKELRATRESVSMGDMSPLSKHVIQGPDAESLLDHLVTRDVTRLEVGHVLYTPWTDDRGKVVGDGLLFRLGKDEFRLSADPQMEWLSLHADGLDVEIKDVSDDWGLLAVQGPRSTDVMDTLTGEEWSEMPFSRVKPTSAAGAELLVARQGFTGELGYEIWVPAVAGADIWDAVAEAGEPFGIQAVGEYAIDVARVEAGLLIVGADYAGAGPDRPGSVIDISPEHQASPFELGLDRFVDLGKETDFIGKSALVRETDTGGPQRRLMGVELAHEAVAALYTDQGMPPLLPNRVWWYPLALWRDGRPMGYATSVTWAPTVGRLVGFGHLDRDMIGSGPEVSVRWTLNDTDGNVPARIVDLPFRDQRRAG